VKDKRRAYAGRKVEDSKARNAIRPLSSGFKVSRIDD
jgi:hypothetical protein